MILEANKKKYYSSLDTLCKTPEDLRHAFQWFSEIHLVNKKTIVLMDGDLGAGKTEFVKQFLLHNNFTDVMSPTFSLINRYEVKNLDPVIHIDLYRTQNEEEIESAGFWDLFLDETNALVFIEWPSRLSDNNVESLFSKDWKIINLRIIVNKDNSRWVHAYA